MKSLLSILKIPILFTAGTIAFSGMAIADEDERAPKINANEVPVPGFMEPYSEEMTIDFRIACYYLIDKKIDICYIRPVNGYSFNGRGNKRPTIGDPYMISVDLNDGRKGKFRVDYTNSQKTNPLVDLQNSKPNEVPKEGIKKSSFPGIRREA